MLDLQIWNIATDIALVFTVVILTARLMVSSKTAANRRAYALEASLRELIREAEEASRGFQEDLRRKQQGIERLLTDLRTQEQRVMQAREELEQLESRSSRRPAVEPEPVLQAAPRQQQAFQQQPRQQQKAAIRHEHIEEPPSFSSRKNAPLSRHVERVKEAEPRPKRQAVNIYGEPINIWDETESFEEELAAQGEPAPLTADEQGHIQSLYDRAEEMLRAGQDLHSVAHMTRLSIDEVRLLSQMVTREEVVQQEGTPVSSRKGRTQITV